MLLDKLLEDEKKIEERKTQGLHPKPIDGADLIKEIIELCLQKKKSDLSALRTKHCFNEGLSDKVFTKVLSELLLK